MKTKIYLNFVVDLGCDEFGVATKFSTNFGRVATDVEEKRGKV